MKSRFYKRRSFLFIIPVIIIALFILASLVSAYLFTNSFHSKVVYPDTMNIPKLDVSFKTSDSVTLKGWYFKNNSSDKAVLLLHGWKANRMEHLSRAKFLYNAGYNVLVYDARGCGESEGDIISIGYYEAEDFAAAMRFLISDGNKKIGYIGISQGGATILLGYERSPKPGCIITESAYDDIENAVDNRFRHYTFLPGNVFGYLIMRFSEMLRGMDCGKMKPFESIKNVKCPIYIISGDYDDRATVENTMSLYNNAFSQKKLWLVKGAGHQDMYNFSPVEYRENVIHFLNDNLR